MSCQTRPGFTPKIFNLQSREGRCLLIGWARAGLLLAAAAPGLLVQSCGEQAASGTVSDPKLSLGAWTFTLALEAHGLQGGVFSKMRPEDLLHSMVLAINTESL